MKPLTVVSISPTRATTSTMQDHEIGDLPQPGFCKRAGRLKESQRNEYRAERNDDAKTHFGVEQNGELQERSDGHKDQENGGNRVRARYWSGRPGRRSCWQRQSLWTEADRTERRNWYSVQSPPTHCRFPSASESKNNPVTYCWNALEFVASSTTTTIRIARQANSMIGSRNRAPHDRKP